jgi:hypothetical protein
MMTTGLDAVYWTRSGLGFDMRLLLGIGKGWKRGEYRTVSDRALEAGLTLGVAFH